MIMLAKGVTYDQLHGAAATVVAICKLQGVDPIELAQAPIDDGFTANEIKQWTGDARANMLACQTVTRRALEQIDYALSIADAESVLCFVTLVASGR
jgi:hypothetical protein